jgi:glucose-1-phosphate thymidylyltransferase
MKGIVLAGGSGSRLQPLTLAVSKQLTPVYDKPMIYYPLATLLEAGIRDVLLISRPDDRHLFERLLGDGSRLGIRIEYLEQASPRGIAEALVLAEPFLHDAQHCCLILGDNLFHGPGLAEAIQVVPDFDGARVFAYPVRDPQAYGVIEFDAHGMAVSIEEKPLAPRSSFAIPGLYVYSTSAVAVAKDLRPSARGELEITDVNRTYLEAGKLQVHVLPRGTAWLDTGTFEALADANAYVRAVEARQGTKIACIEEIAWRQGWIDDTHLAAIAEPLLSSGYGEYLLGLLASSGVDNAP